MVILRGWVSLLFLLIGFLWGCSAVTPPPSSFSSPLFTPTADDTERVDRLTQELDKRALHCLAGLTCEQVHFARALVSLFKNQEAARASFYRVVDNSPSSALSASSRLWLHLIEGEETPWTSANGSQQAFIDLIAQFVRDWMTRELTEPMTQVQRSEPHSMAESSEVVQRLQKQVRERDRRIAVLQSKLEALKLIDEDHQSRKRTLKVPATLP
jgi:hypothetical protein